MMKSLNVTSRLEKLLSDEIKYSLLVCIHHTLHKDRSQEMSLSQSTEYLVQDGG